MGYNQPKLESVSTAAHIDGLTITDGAHIFHLIGLIRTLIFVLIHRSKEKRTK